MPASTLITSQQLFRLVGQRGGPAIVDAPVLASIDVWELLLSVAAAFAIFRFKVGIIATLASAALGESLSISWA